MGETRVAAEFRGCGIRPQRVKLIRGSRKEESVYILLGKDLWWLEARKEAEELSFVEFRESYRRALGLRRNKGYFPLARGDVDVKIEQGDERADAESGHTRKKRLKLTRKKSKKSLTIELDDHLLNDWYDVLRTRVTPWKQLIDGMSPEAHSKGELDKLIEALHGRDEPSREEPTASQSSNNRNQRIPEDGSTLIRMVAHGLGWVAELRHPLSELAKACDTLKEPVRNLSWLPFIGGGLGLVATTIDLCSAFGKNRKDLINADDEALTIAKRLVNTLVGFLESKECSDNFASDFSKTLDKFENQLRLLEHYDFRNVAERALGECVKRGGPTRVLESLKEISAQLGDLQTDITYSISMRHMHNEETCKRSLCPNVRCRNRLKSHIDSRFSIPLLPKYAKLSFDDRHPKRPEKVVKDELLKVTPDRTETAVGVRGIGGAGKTTCVIGVATDEDVRKEFRDGILWVQLRESTTEADMRELLLDLIRYATINWKCHVEGSLFHRDAPLEEICEEGKRVFKGRKCLLVVDDFWKFSRCGLYIKMLKEIIESPGWILFSTRSEDIIRKFEAYDVQVGDLDDETASELFEDWLGRKTEGELEYQYKSQILELSSNLALAVCVAASNVKRLGYDWERVLGDLQGNIANLKEPDEMGYSGNLAAIIQTSLDSIESRGHREAYLCLSVFKKKIPISNQALEALWGTDAANAEARVDLYLEGSLASRKTVVSTGLRKEYFVEFHDRHLEFAQYVCRLKQEEDHLNSRGQAEGVGALQKMHKKIFDGYVEVCSRENCLNVWWENTRLDDCYFYENFAWHLVSSGTREALEVLSELLLAYGWISILIGKLRMSNILEYFSMTIKEWNKRETVGREIVDSGVLEALQLVQGALRCAQPMLWRNDKEDGNELGFQLMGRLQAHFDNPEILEFLSEVQQWERDPWLCPMTQCFESPKTGLFIRFPVGFIVSSVAVVGGNMDIIVVCGYEGGLEIRNGRNGLLLSRLIGHVGCVRSLDVTQDGSHIVSCSEDLTVRVWNMGSGNCEKVLLGHEKCVEAVAVTKDGKSIVSGSRDKTIRVWAKESGTCEKVLIGHTDSVESLALTHSGKYIVSGSMDTTVRVWNMESGNCERLLLGHEGIVYSVVITQDERYIISGSQDLTVRVWGMKSGKCEKLLLGHQDWVSSVSATRDGKYIISGAMDNRVRVWSMESWKCEKVLLGHEELVAALAVTGDGKYILSGGGEAVVVWSMDSSDSEERLLCHEGRICTVAITKDGKYLVSGSADNTIRLWSMESGICERVLTGHEDKVEGVAITQDAKHIVSGSWDRTVRVWNVESGICEKVLLGHEDWVGCVAVSKDGNQVVSGSFDETLRVWSMESGRCEKVLLGHEGFIHAIVVTEDGKHVISASEDGTIRLWSMESGNCEKVLLGHEGEVCAVAIMKDGTHIVSASPDRTMRVWSMESWTCEKVLYADSSLVIGASMEQDLLSMACDDEMQLVRILELEEDKVSSSGSSTDLFGHCDDIGACTLRSEGCFLYPSFIRVEGTTIRIKVPRNNRKETSMKATFDFLAAVFTTRGLWTQGRLVVLTPRGFVILQITP